MNRGDVDEDVYLIPLTVNSYIFFYFFRMLNEQDLALARALVAEEKDTCGSPGPLRKKPLGNMDERHKFR